MFVGSLLYRFDCFYIGCYCYCCVGFNLILIWLYRIKLCLLWVYKVWLVVIWLSILLYWMIGVLWVCCVVVENLLSVFNMWLLICLMWLVCVLSFVCLVMLFIFFMLFFRIVWFGLNWCCLILLCWLMWLLL